MAKLTGSTIRITSTDTNATTTIGINGKNRRLPHNEDVAVSQAELEVLEASHVTFEVTGTADAKALEGAVDSPGPVNTAADRVQTPGADFLAGSSPSDADLVVRLTPPDDATTPGADHLLPTLAPDVAAARETARENADKVEDGTIEPAVELTNADPQQVGTDQSEGTGDVGSTGLAVAPFDAGQTLEQPIKKITEDMDEFTRPQLAELLKAERDGQQRTTLIQAIDKKLAA